MRIDCGRLLEWRPPMTFDEAVALSLAENLSRVDLTARLLGADPELRERAQPLLERAHFAPCRDGTEGGEQQDCRS